MSRPIAILGAPSSIGIKPYDDGGVRRLDLAPTVLRERGLAARLAARDHGDVPPPAYRDFERPPGGIRNLEEVESYSRSLADRIAAAREDGAFVMVLGGDCSIVLGCLFGLRGAGPNDDRGRVGLAYVDAHADFATPEESTTGSAASMCLALAMGRGDSPLARLAGNGPLVNAADVAVLGRRDHAVQYEGQEVLRASPLLDLGHDAVRERGAAGVASLALERLAAPASAGFWIHVDADVLDPEVMPAVDSPEPNGLELDELAGLVEPLARHPKALGLQLTIYDPALDPERTCATRLADLLERVLRSD